MTDKTGRMNCSVETDETAVLETENDRYRDRRIAHNLPSTRSIQLHTSDGWWSAQYTGRLSRSALTRF